jgi:hypothetical protein
LFSGLDKADKTALHDLLGKARAQFLTFKS